MESIFRMDGAGVEAACMGVVDSVNSYLLKTRFSSGNNAETRSSDERKHPLPDQVSVDMFKITHIHMHCM